MGFGNRLQLPSLYPLTVCSKGLLLRLSYLFWGLSGQITTSSSFKASPSANFPFTVEAESSRAGPLLLSVALLLSVLVFPLNRMVEREKWTKRGCEEEQAGRRKHKK